MQSPESQHFMFIPHSSDLDFEVEKDGIIGPMIESVEDSGYAESGCFFVLMKDGNPWSTKWSQDHDIEDEKSGDDDQTCFEKPIPSAKPGKLAREMMTEMDCVLNEGIESGGIDHWKETRSDWFLIDWTLWPIDGFRGMKYWMHFCVGNCAKKTEE